MNQLIIRILIIFIIVILPFRGQAQRTIGLIEKVTSGEDSGYTLFSPISSRNTYLIDSCGLLVRQWASSYVPGQTAYLLADGSLLRAARIPGDFTGGGIGGRIEKYDWEGNQQWAINLANSRLHQHHVAHPMPNGNILTVVWYKYSKEEALNKGFDPAKLTNEGIWSDRILEIKPLPDDSYEIVWEWDFWDHTIQDVNPTLDNFGNVADHPELLDVNFFEDPGPNPSEWLHVNALDYNEKLDQIIISSKFHNEFYIIDHATTTQEAMGHSGGKYGKGGDFLYRWGNPRSYKKGSQEDHWLFGQHDVQWIDEGLPGQGNILLFNNGSNRIGTLYSAVEELIPPIDSQGKYLLNANGRFGPDKPSWSYTADPITSLYSSRVSGAQRLTNGNTLVCEGNKGNFIEVDKFGKVLWKYRNPVNNFGPSLQGQVPQNIDVFKAVRYHSGHPALNGRSLSGTSTLEINQIPYDCELISGLENGQIAGKISIQNPVADQICFKESSGVCFKYKIYSMEGKLHSQDRLCNGDCIPTGSLPSGIFILNFSDETTGNVTTLKFIKPADNE